MAKKLKTKTILFDLVILGALLILGYYIAVKFISNTSYNPVQTNNDSIQTKTYRSKGLKFSIVVPSRSEVVENSGSLLIKTSNGTITIGQNGTNFSNLKEYIANSRNDLQSRILERRDLNINGLDATSGRVENQKMYLIYTNYNVYLLFTTSPSLFNDLDKIAQSFRYTP